MIYGGKTSKVSDGSSSALLGSGLFIVSLLLLTLETAVTRRIGASIPPEQLALLRSLGGIVLVAVLAGREGIRVCYTELPWLQLLRGSVSVAGLWTYYYAFSRLPLAEATALSYTKASWLAVFAVLILRERINPLRWIAIVIAGTGAVVIIDPGHISVGIASVAAFGSAALSATIITLTKLLERRDRPITVMFYVAVISFVGFVGPGISHWVPTDRVSWLVVTVVMLGPIGQYIGIIAMRSVDASIITPLDYTRLVFAGVLGYFLFAELPSTRNVVGSLLIILGCLVAAASSKELCSVGTISSNGRRRSPSEAVS